MISSLNRRNFLKGVGVSIAIPALESLGAPAVKAPSAKRFVCVSPNYGMNPAGFFPENTGVNYDLPLLLQPLKRLAKKTRLLMQKSLGAR